MEPPDGGCEVEEEEASSESSTNSLLDGPVDLATGLMTTTTAIGTCPPPIPQTLTESNTETTQTLTLDEDLEGICHAHLLSVSTFL